MAGQSASKDQENEIDPVYGTMEGDVSSEKDVVNGTASDNANDENRKWNRFVVGSIIIFGGFCSL